MTMLDDVKQTLGLIVEAARKGNMLRVQCLAEGLSHKIAYYEKGADEALCAMEKSWKARDEPRIQDYWKWHEELEKELKGRKDNE